MTRQDAIATALTHVARDFPWGSQWPEGQITEEDIDKVLGKAMRLKNGLLRASASRFVPGRPIGPFKYEGTRSDDPNDVIDHQDRRISLGEHVESSLCVSNPGE